MCMKGIKLINIFQTTTDDTYIMQEKIIDKLIKVIKLENEDISIKMKIQ